MRRRRRRGIQSIEAFQRRRAGSGKYLRDGGHTHCAFPSDQESELQYFLNKFMKGQTSLSQTIRTAPSSYSTINYARWTQWWGTSNPVLP